MHVRPHVLNNELLHAVAEVSAVEPPVEQRLLQCTARPVGIPRAGDDESCLQVTLATNLVEVLSKNDSVVGGRGRQGEGEGRRERVRGREE